MNLRHYTRESDHRTVEIPLNMSVTIKRRNLTDPDDPDIDAEKALHIIEKALDEYGGEAHGLLVALGWRKPDDDGA